MSTPEMTDAERAEVLDWVKACEGHALADRKPEGPIRNVSGLAACRAGLAAYVETMLAARVQAIESSPAPVQPDTSNSAEFDGIETLAHRMAWRYKKSSDPAHSDTWKFNSATLAQFARAVSESVQPQADPVAEIIECSKMGQQTVKEIEGRWKFLDCGTKLYAGAAPVAQAEPMNLTDQQIYDWWASENGLEDCDMCNVSDFATVIQIVEKRVLAAMKGAP